MAWDFSTDPEFQEQLDWVDEFVTEECEPLDMLFPGAAKSKHPPLKRLVDPLKQQTKDRGLWGLFLDEGPGRSRPGAAQARALERDPRPLGLGPP